MFLPNSKFSHNAHLCFAVFQTKNFLVFDWFHLRKMFIFVLDYCALLSINLIPTL